MTPAHAPRRRFRLRRTALLVIPLVALAAFAGCADGTGPPPPDDRPPAAPEPLTPRGAGPVPAAFTWKRVPGDRIYRVTVTDAAERPLYHFDVRNVSSLQFPEELKAMMTEQQGMFRWSVAIVTPDGSVLAQSPAVQFWLK